MSVKLAEPGRSAAVVHELLAERTRANQQFFASEGARIAELCHHIAERFSRGGRIVACGLSPAARSDVRHVAVEFVHPVIVGKRALPALGLTGDGGSLKLQCELLLQPNDIVIAFDGPECVERDRGVLLALAAARKVGALTIGFSDAPADWQLVPPSHDPFIRQELVETLYHVLWELVHVFFEHRGLLQSRTKRNAHDSGGSSFLYPFLAEQERNLDHLLGDVQRSIGMKAAEVGQLRTDMLARSGDALTTAARELHAALDAGATVLALGNGGSATDAMDLVADLRAPPQGWPARRALELTEDAAILTAIGNDVGIDSIFARQIIAYGREGDVVIAFTTSGSSRNVARALEEARRRGLRTIAFSGYDGGVIAAEGLADISIIAPSQYIPRIQEAHATGYHLLRELIELG